MEKRLQENRLLGPREYERCLAELRPQIGHYGWMWASLRLLARARGGFPWTVWMRLQRWGNPRKPYFVGRTADGTLYLGDYRELYAAHFAVYADNDLPLLNFLKRRLQQSPGAFFDVGANMGILAASVARSLPECPVYAFEPLPETIRRASATFALNKLNNVTLVPCAVGDENGDLTFYAAPNHSDIASVYTASQREEAKAEATTVACRTLDSLVLEGVIKPACLMKIDVEGHEYKALAGAQQILARDKPALVFEYNYTLAPQAGWTPQDAAALLCRSASYDLKTLGEDGSLRDYPPEPTGPSFVNIYADIKAL
jgi:FkbM family methyltransferase